MSNVTYLYKTNFLLDFNPEPLKHFVDIHSPMEEKAYFGGCLINAVFNDEI